MTPEGENISLKNLLKKEFQMNLAKHPIFEMTDPSRNRLVRFSEPFPSWLNPFSKDGVVIRAIGLVHNIKHHVGRELVLDGLLKSLITRETVVLGATSGGTGKSIALHCNALSIKSRFIMSSDTVADKVNAISVLGRNVEVVLHSDPHESTVQRARREGAEKDCYDTDQYANPKNPWAHKRYL